MFLPPRCAPSAAGHLFILRQIRVYFIWVEESALCCFFLHYGISDTFIGALAVYNGVCLLSR